jgi:hypothetical protein
LIGLKIMLIAIKKNLKKYKIKIKIGENERKKKRS